MCVLFLYVQENFLVRKSLLVLFKSLISYYSFFFCSNWMWNKLVTSLIWNVCDIYTTRRVSRISVIFLKTRFFCRSCLCSILEHIWYIMMPSIFCIVCFLQHFLSFTNVSLQLKSLRQFSTNLSAFSLSGKSNPFLNAYFSYRFDYILVLTDLLSQTLFIHVNKLYAK